MAKHRHNRHEHKQHERRVPPEAVLDQRHILESFIGALSALMIVVLILAPLVGARRARR